MEVLKVLLGQRGVYRQADYQMTTISQVRERPFISRDREMTTYMYLSAGLQAKQLILSFMLLRLVELQTRGASCKLLWLQCLVLLDANKQHTEESF